MAASNKVEARASIVIGGVEASRKNLQSLKESAAALGNELERLNKEQKKFEAAGDLLGAEKTVAAMRKTETALKNTRKLIGTVENEIKNYTDVLDNLSGSTLQKLSQGARTLQAQMKAQATADNVEQWKKMNAAYKQVMQTIEQLNGKAPNLGYVMQNIGRVSKQSLSDTVSYLERLISTTDRTTKTGISSVKQWRDQLRQVQAEQKARAVAAIEKPTGSKEDLTAAINQLKALQAPLRETSREYQVLQEHISKGQELLKTYADTFKSGQMSKELKNIGTLSTSALSEQKRYWQEMVNGAERGSEALNTYSRELQKVIEEERKREDTRVIDNVVKKAESGTASMEEMEKAIAAINDRLRKTPKNQTQEIERLRQHLDKLNPALAQTRIAVSNVEKTLGNIKGSSINSLKEAASALEAELKNVNGKTDEFVEKATQLKQVKQQIKEMESAWNNTGSALDKAYSRLKSWVLVYTSASKAGDLFQSAYQSTLKMSDLMTDVRKTTGMTSEEISKLADNIQKLDTRISNEKLLEAATEGGRLGLRGIENIEAFTKASAITLTALDELDARSITSVMKLNSLLGETDKLGVQQAILSTASSINELSMASSAAQQPIIDFSRRFGGIAAQANITTSDVLALGATIDALGQPVEMSSTALNKFTTALVSNSEQIAEDLGLNEDRIVMMIRQGKTMEVMIEVLSKLNEMGGIGEISKYMGDMGGDGARMTAVISALAANIGFMREQIEVSNQAFLEGTSVINEYNLKNENAAALVERIGNHFKEVFVKSDTVNALTGFLRLLERLVSFITSGTAWAKAFNNVMLIFTLYMMNGVKAIKSFNLSLIAAGKWLVTFGVGLGQSVKNLGFWNAVLAGCTYTVKGLWNALKGLMASNPLGWAVLGVSLLYDLATSFGKTKESTEELTSAMDEANKNFAEEEYKLNKLREALDAAAKSNGNLHDIISQLNMNYADHIGYVLREAAAYEEVQAAINLVNKSLREKAIMDAQAGNFQRVDEKYREEKNEQARGVRADIESVFGSKTGIAHADRTAVNDLYNSIQRDLIEGANLGEAKIGKATDEILRRIAASQVNFAKSMRMAFSRKGMKIDYSSDENIENSLYEAYRRSLSSFDSVQELADVYNRRAAELAETEQDTKNELAVAGKERTEAIVRQREALVNSSQILDKTAEEFTPSDEQAFEGLIKLQSQLLTRLAREQVTLQGDALEKNKAEYARLDKELKNYKEMQRNIMLAWVENPLKNVEVLRKNEAGKMERQLDEYGNVQYEALDSFSEATSNQLIEIVKRGDKVHKELLEDYARTEDSTIRESALKLSNTLVKIKAELETRGERIGSNYELELLSRDDSGSVGRTAHRENNEMQKAYWAMLANIKEYFDKRKQLVNEAYLSDETTTDQHNLMLEQLERAYLNTRISMQKELLGKGNEFSEETYIRDLENFKKVKGWMLKETHHFQDEVRSDMESSVGAVQESLIKQKDEVTKLLLDNDYQKQVDKEMQSSFEKTGLFWGKRTELTIEASECILEELKKASIYVYEMDDETFKKRLSANTEFGDMVKSMSAEQYDAFLILLKQYHDKTIIADKKFADERSRIINQQWAEGGYKEGYESAEGAIDRQENEYSFMAGNDAIANRLQGFDMEKELILKRVSLEEWRYQTMRDLYDKNNATQEMYDALDREHLEKQNEYQQKLLENYSARYQHMAEVTQNFGNIIGNGLGNMIAGQEDAGKELVKALLTETINMASEFTKRLILQETFGGAMQSIKNTQNAQQLAAAYSTAMAEVGIESSKMAAIEAIAAGKITAESMAMPDSVLSFGASGAARAAVIIGLVSVATAAALALVNSLFPGSANESSGSKKRLAAGMLTYASGRYPVPGADGETYDAQYEPVLQTKVYPGGKNKKAHFGLFSEKMPEMVVSGPTTKIIQENYPEIMDAILTVEKHGRLKYSMPVFADGSYPYAGGAESAAYRQEENGVFVPVENNRMSDALEMMERTIAALNDTLVSGKIKTRIDMYGKGGVKESMDKADTVYRRNNIKSGK